MQKEENAGNCENLQFSVEICKLCSYNFVLERLPLPEARLAELFFILFVSQGFYLTPLTGRSRRALRISVAVAMSWPSLQ